MPVRKEAELEGNGPGEAAAWRSAAAGGGGYCTMTQKPDWNSIFAPLSLSISQQNSISSINKSWTSTRDLQFLFKDRSNPKLLLD